MEAFLTRYYRLLFGALMVAIAGLAFYVGMLEGKQSGGERVALMCSDEVLEKLAIPLATIGNTDTGTSSTADLTASASSVAQTKSTPPQGKFAGSKNGTKYYTPGCAGLNRIKPENIIWFQNADDATLQGYTPARC